ncbi:hypothetical protein RB213_008562 [Colletotrichum asianum]
MEISSKLSPANLNLRNAGPFSFSTLGTMFATPTFQWASNSPQPKGRILMSHPHHSSTSSTNTVLHVDLDIHSQQSRPTPLGNRSKPNPGSPPLPAPHQPTANATARQVKTA